MPVLPRKFSKLSTDTLAALTREQSRHAGSTESTRLHTYPKPAVLQPPPLSDWVFHPEHVVTTSIPPDSLQQKPNLKHTVFRCTILTGAQGIFSQSIFPLLLQLQVNSRLPCDRLYNGKQQHLLCNG